MSKIGLSNEESNQHFSEKFPQRSNLNTEAPNLPIHYRREYNINTNSRQEFIENNNFYKRNNSTYNDNENKSFKQIAVPHHINLYVLCFNR